MLSVPITLFSCASRGGVAGGVDHQARVDDGVDLGGLHDPADQRVLVRDAHELGALELARRVLGVDADDRLDRRVALERLARAARPSRSDRPVTSMRLLSVIGGILPWRRTVDGVQAVGRMAPWHRRTASEADAGPRMRSGARSGLRWTRGSRALPGRQERIPNFANARGAAERLARHPAWKRAKTIKANPDAPQTHSRRLALEQGKTLVMAVPRLRDEHPFRLLDPRSCLTKAKLREAATIKGALKHGEVIDVEQVPKLDLILCGSVAVNLKGARIGKGGGFSDLEYALLAEAGTVSDEDDGRDDRAPDPDPAREPPGHRRTTSRST